jgi:hypothetical protein
MVTVDRALVCQFIMSTDLAVQYNKTRDDSGSMHLMASLMRMSKSAMRLNDNLYSFAFGKFESREMV